MSCPHPATAQHMDRSRGTVMCTICGEVVNDQQLELDPLFARGERPAAGATRSGLRALGQPRPMRTTTHVTPVSQRPSVELARRSIYNIARQLEISGDMAEMATGVYKLAVTNNAIAGARNAILCACLYAVCRREGTNHLIYDFADATKDSPYEILRYMRYICEVTHTPLPPMDISLLVYRFAEQLQLGDLTRDIAICALKIIRAMRDDWLEYGRKPLGVVAAALIVACNVYSVQRTADQLCGMVRLTAPTIQKRLSEFLQTPTSLLSSIDDYRPSNETAPPAFGHGIHGGGSNPIQPNVDDQLRQLAAEYYELVAEAKRSAPATSERCERWRTFITSHCQMNNLPLDEANCDLTRFSPKEQLVLLGLPHAMPVMKEETSKAVITTKQEPLTLPQEIPSASSGQMPLSSQLKMFDKLVESNEDVLDLNAQIVLDESCFGSSKRDVLASQRYATWELVDLPPLASDANDDTVEYIIDDLEARIKLERASQELHKEKWERGQAKSIESILATAFAEGGTRKRRREPISEQLTVQAALERALRGKGASTINVSGIDSLIPGLSNMTDETAASDHGSVDDDWY